MMFSSTMVFSDNFLQHPPIGWHVEQTSEATFVWRKKRGMFKLTGLAEVVGDQRLWAAIPV